MAKKVLVIEDDKFLRKAYQSKLALSGFEVRSAMNGEEGIAMLKEFVPDAVLLDLVMAKKSGFDVLAEVRRDPELNKRGTPIIVLSSLAQESDIRRAKDLGASDFMVKSNTPINAVVDKINFHLKTGKAKK
jgi:DNA-binding response OmpR family regulator